MHLFDYMIPSHLSVEKLVFSDVKHDDPHLRYFSKIFLG